MAESTLLPDPICLHFQTDSGIRETAEMMGGFAILLRERQDVAELKGFAAGLRKDYETVKAGLTEVWSSGKARGQVHRLKLLKRQSYGSASFQTLRKRVLR